MRISLSMFFGAAVAVAVFAPGAAFADGDAAKGAKVFKRYCKACHIATEAKNKTGPHLVGIIDRPVASVEGYSYSPAMVEHATEVPMWSVEALDPYLRNPKGVVKKTKMIFRGLKKDKDVDDLIAYLTDPAVK